MSVTRDGLTAVIVTYTGTPVVGVANYNVEVANVFDVATNALGTPDDADFDGLAAIVAGELTLEDDGGYWVEVSYNFPLTAYAAVYVGAIDEERLCYAGAVRPGQADRIPGDGQEHRIIVKRIFGETNGTASFAIPPLPPGGPYALIFVADDASQLVISSYLTIVRHNYLSSIYRLRGMLRPQDATGPRSIDLEPPI